MNIDSSFLIWMLIAALAGFGWGQWYAEQSFRVRQEEANRGRLSVSMPLDPDDAEATLGLLKELVRQVKHEKAEGQQ